MEVSVYCNINMHINVDLNPQHPPHHHVVLPPSNILANILVYHPNAITTCIVINFAIILEHNAHCHIYHSSSVFEIFHHDRTKVDSISTFPIDAIRLYLLFHLTKFHHWVAPHAVLAGSMDFAGKAGGQDATFQFSLPAINGKNRGYSEVCFRSLNGANKQSLTWYQSVSQPVPIKLYLSPSGDKYPSR